MKDILENDENNTYQVVLRIKAMKKKKKRRSQSEIPSQIQANIGSDYRVSNFQSTFQYPNQAVVKENSRDLNKIQEFYAGAMDPMRMKK